MNNKISDIKRVFLIVLDSYGIGEMPDAEQFGDVGSNTLGSIVNSTKYNTPNLKKLGLFNIEGVNVGKKEACPLGSFARLKEASNGKDTTIGHWEIAGMISKTPLPTYPNGFPKNIIDEFEQQTGHKTLCNMPYSGTTVIADYGKQHVETGDLIVYTSGDSVFQIAAHEDIIPLDELYRYCEIARKILVGEHAVGRVIARPFTGESPNFTRTSNRHDFSLLPPKTTMLDQLVEAGLDTYGIGKIYDIFAGKNVQHTQRIQNNTDGMNKTLEMQNQDFHGLCFVNLVDFDMNYGHRRDIDGYAQAATDFDLQLESFLKNMKKDDVLMITADHGCDPGYQGTDHTREHVPFLIYGDQIKENNSLGTRESFADIAATVLELLGVENRTDGTSVAAQVLK